MFSTVAGPRHQRYKTGPWRGMETNQFDPANANHGSLKLAKNVIFETPTEGKGYSTPARVRPGRHNWNSDTLLQRFYLTEAESNESGWTGGSFDTAIYKFGYASRLRSHAGAAATDTYRIFSAVDASQAGLSSAFGTQTLYFWVRVNTPANLTAANCRIEVTSDVGPGAPPWTNYVSVALNTSTWNIGTVVADTWTRLSVPLPSMTQTGAFNPAAITGINLHLDSSAAVDVRLDEAYFEAVTNPGIVGLHEFFKSTTGERFLLAKSGDTLYIDKDESLTFTKVRSNMARNMPTYAAKIYNQIFLTDADQQVVIDGTLNAGSAYNHRAIGFPAPVSPGSVTNVAGGTLSTAGVHHCWMSYIYGNGATVYGQSNMTYIGSVTIGANERYSFSSLAVPTEKEGVIAKRLFIGLAGDPQDASAYFAIELTAADTTEVVDISDATLSAASNPIGPRTNDVPGLAKYLLPFEGSLLYLRLSTNPTAVAYSRPGTDINSGPEIVPATNIAVSQRGEPWTGGIVRDRTAYLFTRRSIHEGKFDQFGQLLISEKDSSVIGSSVSVGAIDQRAIWADDENNIFFQSEYGLAVIEPGGRVVLLSKRKLLDEWKNINDREMVNSFDFRLANTQAEWALGTVGSNLLADTDGLLKYRYPTNVDLALTTLGVSYGNNGYAGNLNNPLDQSIIGPTPFVDPAFYKIQANGNKIEGGATLWMLCKANVPLRINGATLKARKGDNSSQQVNFTIGYFSYQYGRKATYATTDTQFVNAAADFRSDTQSGATDSIQTWAVTFGGGGGGMFVPKGEFFWLGIGSVSASVKPLLVQPGYHPSLYMADKQQDLGWVYSGSVLWNQGTAGGADHTYAPAVQLDFTEVLDTVTEHDVDAGSSIQRYSFLSQATMLTNMNASQRVVIEMATAALAAGPYSNYQVMWDQEYEGVGNAKYNKAVNPFYALTDYRPNTAITAYPHKQQNRFVRYRITVQHGSNYGSDINTVNDSLISATHGAVFLSPTQTIRQQISTESSFSEPFANDLWTSASGTDAFDMQTTPTEWGRFVVDFLESQQRITMQVRTSAANDFSTTSTWYNVPMNYVPNTTELPINGRYVQVRFLFTDDMNGNTGIASYINSFSFSYKRVNALAPLLPPAGCFFERYHLLAYAPKSSRLNTEAWCLSPGDKFAIWDNQPIACWCVYDNKLLAGKQGAGKVSQYWDEDYQDDAVGSIQGTIVGNPTNCGADNIKTFFGILVFSGCREFKGIPRAVADIVPALTPPADMCFAGIYNGSFDNQTAPPNVIGLPLLNSVSDAAGFRYIRPSHSQTGAVAVVGGDAFYSGFGDRMDAVVQVFWSARSHTIKDYIALGTPQRKRFPYLTDIHLELFLENSYGL